MLKTALLLLFAKAKSILVNGSFADSTGWSGPIAGASITGGTLTFDGTTSMTNGAIITTGTVNPPVVVGQKYAVTYTIVSDLSLSVSVNVGSALGTGRAAAGTYTDTLTATTTTPVTIQARISTGARTGSITNISVVPTR